MKAGWVIISVLAGMAIGLWIGYSVSETYSEEELNEVIQQNEEIIGRQEERLMRSQQILDSLAQVTPQIEIRYEEVERKHSNRDSLPFDINDTGARYRFFSERFPDLFAGQGD